MNINLLRNALQQIKSELESAISSSSWNGKQKDSGLQAKESYIRSSGLINHIHECAKLSFKQLFDDNQYSNYAIYPQIGKTRPELKFSGYLKRKDQDIVICMDNSSPSNEVIDSGVLLGTNDAISKMTMRDSIVINIRSQMSSIEKNFDTLMERAFAETTNIRLREPRTVMGEIYLLPVFEYDNDLMKNNEVSWKERKLNVKKFLNTFRGFSDRPQENYNDLYTIFQYDRSALIFVNFQTNPPTLYESKQQLFEDGLIDEETLEYDYNLFSTNFAKDIWEIYKLYHI